HNSELLRSLQARNYDLEQEINKRERSENLNRKLESCIEVSTAVLSEASDYFQQAQDQVEKHEKLSSLGELVAGVAHEINNPIGCITNNVEFIAEHTQQLIEHIFCYRDLLEANRDRIPPPDLAKVEQHAKSIELDYIVEDVPVLIESMSTSGDRIQAISQSLRTFARSDTTEKQPYNLNEGLDGTLLILRHRLKGGGDCEDITIHKDYTELPNISCYPGQVNQVFMNILANAIDAMESGIEPDGPGKISVITAADDEQIIVTITDNAGGMPESIRERIFERQFTTKTAGKGTGLGLSIAHQIVTEGHQGNIVCESIPGKGTTFKITLPIETLPIE
ncbi:MAG: ATP-binding protein, partial [Cyanobacteria bacterium J06576_12]